MRKEFSIYLDLVRFIAALLVVIHHSNFRQLSAKPIPFSQHGPAAVIIFFVLSGYVISYVTESKEREPVDYWSSRLSRFYSVAVPIILLCPLLDMAGEALAPQFYVDKTTHGLAWLRVLASLTFSNELWTLSIMPFSNVPYWSLCYEMAYYALFAIFMFTVGKGRLLLMAGGLLLVGPKIILLAPIWVLGVVLHRYQPLNRLAQWQYWLLFVISWPLYGLYHEFDLAPRSAQLLGLWIGEKWQYQLAFSKYFLANYLLALIVAANFIGFRGVAHRFATPLRRSEKVIRWLSGYTFSLYIFHQPLLQFYSAVFNGDPSNKLFYTEVIVATLLSVVVGGRLTEHKRHHLRKWIHGALSAMTAAKWWRQSITAAISPKQAGA
jgi:peptidoglycan/LPS O-acetylase OafA/YrhL